MHGMSLAERLEAAARNVQRLAPDHRNPERYFVQKDALRAELRALAKEVRQHGTLAL